MRRIVVVLFLLFVGVEVSAESLCADVFASGLSRLSLEQIVGDQISVSLPMIRRFSRDPYVHNLAHDILASQGRIINSGGIVQLRSELVYKGNGVVELEIFHLRLPEMSIGEISRSLYLNFAKFLVALEIALESLIRDGSQVVELKLSTIVNARLRDLTMKIFSDNPTVLIQEEIVGYKIQVTIFAPERPW